MHVLVVGGAGYLGSVTVERLLDAGHQVTVLDNLIAGHAAAVHRKAELVVADDRDGEALNRLFSTYQIDAVVYSAGYIQAGESMRHPDRYFANNVVGPICLINAMLARNVKFFIYSSSAVVYGEPTITPIDEETSMQPTNPYGESKAIVERMLRWYDSQHGLRYISLRHFNPAGANERLGEDHRPETHLIPTLLKVALGQRAALALYGTDYPTPDGTCIRDYVHVFDLAYAYTLALEMLAKGGPSGIYNLGCGRGLSNREVIEAARQVTGESITVQEEERRPGEPAIRVASTERARVDLGWTPRITSIEEIIESAWRWQQAHPQGYPEG